MFLTVADVARRIGVRPNVLSTLFYRGDLSNEQCPVIGGRRIIPPDYVPQIVAELRRRDIPMTLPEVAEGSQ